MVLVRAIEKTRFGGISFWRASLTCAVEGAFLGSRFSRVRTTHDDVPNIIIDDDTAITTNPIQLLSSW